MEMYTLPELSLFIIKGGRMSPELLKRPPPSEQLLSKAFRTKMTSKFSSASFQGQAFHYGDAIVHALFLVLLRKRMAFVMYYV